MNSLKPVSAVVQLSEKDVVDQEAYQEYLRLKNHPILNEKAKYKASTGEIISLGTVGGQLNKKIEHLPEEEQQKILNMKKIYYRILCTRNGMKVKAFGQHVDGNNNAVSAPVDRVFGERKYELIELFGRMFSIKEVHQVCLEQFKLPCTVKQLEEFYKTFSPEIATRVEEYQRSYSDIRLGHKRSRLEELSWLYVKRKKIYEITKKGEDHRLLLQTLEQLRKEAEGDQLRINGTLDVNIENAIQTHINQELARKAILYEIIIARVASRAGLAVEKMVQAMNRSFYKESFNQDEPKRIETFPSSQTYDFDKIARIQNASESERISEANTPNPVLSEEKTEQVNNIKALLLAKLQSKKGDVNYIKNQTLAQELNRNDENNNK